MRVLLVAPHFPEYESDPDGFDVWRTAEALVDRGHSVAAVAPARMPGAAKWLGRIAVDRAPRAGAFGWLRFLGPARAAIEREAAAGMLHLIHAWGWSTAGLAAALANRHQRPLVITVSEDDLRLARRIPLGGVMMGAVLRQARVVTATGGYVADAVARPARRAREAVPITPAPILGLASAVAYDGVAHGVVYAGPLERGMGVHHLIDALAVLKRNGLPLDLTIVGDGPERATLKAQALAAGVPVLFAGYVPPADVAAHLAGRRVCVVPATEATPATIIATALAQGVPVVATTTGGAPDLLTEDAAGQLVPPGDPAALAAAIRVVVTDDMYVTGALNAGRGLLARRSPAAVAAAFEQVYLDARGRRSAAGRASGPGARTSPPPRHERPAD